MKRERGKASDGGGAWRESEYKRMLKTFCKMAQNQSKIVRINSDMRSIIRYSPLATTFLGLFLFRRRRLLIAEPMENPYALFLYYLLKVIEN